MMGDFAARDGCWLRVLAGPLLLLAILVGGTLGLAQSQFHDNVTLIWPPTGIATAAALLFGLRVWPILAIGAFLVTASTGAPAAFALITAIGNPLQAVAARGLLNRGRMFDPSLQRVLDVLCFLLAVPLSALVSAGIGTAGLCAAGLSPWSAYLYSGIVWWAGDATGALLLAPALLTAGAWRRETWMPARIAEAALLLLSLLAAGAVVYGGLLDSAITAPLAYAGFPVVIWAALRFGPHGATLTIVLLAAIAVAGALRGQGPFEQGDHITNLLYLHGFLAILAAVGMILAAIRCERLHAQTALQAAHDALERRVQRRTAELAQANRALQAEIDARQRTLHELQLVQSINAAVVNASDYDAALGEVLRLICANVGGDYAEAWLPAADGQVLLPGPHWQRADGLLSVFRTASNVLTFLPGSGLPGRVWLSQQPEWIADVAAVDEAGFARTECARRTGLRAGFALPIIAAQEVLAVLVFFLARPQPADPHLLGKVAAVAAQLGTLLQRKRAATAVREAQARLVEITDGIPGAVYQLEMDTTGEMRFSFLSRGITDLYGLGPAAATPEALFAPVHAEDLPHIDEATRQSAASLAPWSCEFRIHAPTGEKWIRGHAIPRQVSDRTIRWNGLLVDITEEKRIREQLSQAQKMETVGQLTGGIAHDFNNLLAIVIGNLDLLEAHLEHDPAGKALAQAALGAGLRGAELTRQLLAFARRQPLQAQAVDLNMLVAGMTELLERTLGETIAVRRRLAEDLRAAEADPAQVESALANLAINARDAMPTGGQLTIETANVRLDAAYAAQNAEVVPGDYVMLAVTDTGVGIPPEVLPQVFDPFFTTKEVGRGSGLGLSMIYGFARQSRGHVKIYSEVGHGTTVRLYLPCAGSAGGSVASMSLPAAEPARGMERILVVEDNAAVRQTVVQQLNGLGYRTLEAENGPAALALLERNEPVDLLFTDIVMPGGMTGIELSQIARDRRPGLKLLCTSGFTEHSVRIGSADGISFLSKPYRKQELAQKIRDILNEALE